MPEWRGSIPRQARRTESHISRWKKTGGQGEGELLLQPVTGWPFTSLPGCTTGPKMHKQITWHVEDLK